MKKLKFFLPSIDVKVTLKGFQLYHPIKIQDAHVFTAKDKKRIRY